MQLTAKLHRPAWLRPRCVTKTLFIMKLTAFFLTIALLSVKAEGTSQVITLSGKDLSLEKIFRVVEKQTGYVVFISKEMLRGAKPVSVDAKNEPLTPFLTRCFENQSFGFTIDDKTILITRKTANQLTAPVVVQLPPLFTLRGFVRDATGRPVSSVSITIKGSKNAVAMTDEKGYFMVNAEVGDIVSFSSIGFEPEEFKILNATQNEINIFLRPAVVDLKEIAVVNTGYQIISRERATGSYSTVETKRLDSKLQPNLLTALEGQAAGVVVTKDGKMEIRGQSTFLGVTQPLIVVDGFPISGGLETVNIDNIESITVLKDAVAASIYGARSSNGVVVITTKNAKKGKVQIGYKGSTGITQRPDLSYLNKTSTADFIDAELEYYALDPISPTYTYDVSTTFSRVTALAIQRDRHQITQAQMDAEISQLKKNDALGQLQKYVFRPMLTQQHNLSLSAGNEKSSTNAAIRYITNRNNTIYNSDNRLIFDLKNDWKPVSNVTVRLFSNINFSNSKAPARPVSQFYSYRFNVRPYDLLVDPATGQPLDIPEVRQPITQFNNVAGLKPMNYNPIADLALETTKTQDYQARLGASINVNIGGGLTADVGGIWTRGSGLVRTIYDADAFRVRAAYNGGTSKTNNTKHYVPDGAIIDESRNTNESYTFRGQLNFNKVLNNKHRITAIAGGEINKDVIDNNASPTRMGYNEQAGGFLPLNYQDLSNYVNYSDMLLGGPVIIPSNGSYSLRDQRFVSAYANGSYEYDNRFIVSGSARLDQTNFFGTNPKYRYKPNWSVGGTYKLSNESFFKASWIDKLYLRGSYGINGNISLKQGPYLLVNSVGYTAASGGYAYLISSLPNNDLRWERTKITNIGTDLSFFKGRLNASIDYYNKLSVDLFAPDLIDNTYGRSSIIRNIGSARNTGIELSLEADVVKTKNFNWNVLFNGSYNKSRVLTYNDNTSEAASLTMLSSAALLGETGAGLLRKGYPMDALLSYRFAGLNNQGIATFYNADKSSKVLGGAVKGSDLVYSGTIRPKYVLNLTNTFSYRSLDLSFMIIAKLGNVFRADSYYGNNYDNKFIAQRWRVPGDEAKTIYPALTTSYSAPWYYPYADVFVRNGNYMKLRDLTVSYTLNNKLWGHTGFNNVKVYLSGRNLVTITANKDGIDPETATSENGSFSRTLPIMKEFYAGLSINF